MDRSSFTAGFFLGAYLGTAVMGVWGWVVLRPDPAHRTLPRPHETHQAPAPPAGSAGLIPPQSLPVSPE